MCHIRPRMWSDLWLAPSHITTSVLPVDWFTGAHVYDFEYTVDIKKYGRGGRYTHSIILVVLQPTYMQWILLLFIGTKFCYFHLTVNDINYFEVIDWALTCLYSPENIVNTVKSMEEEDFTYALVSKTLVSIYHSRDKPCQWQGFAHRIGILNNHKQDFSSSTQSYTENSRWTQCEHCILIYFMCWCHYNTGITGSWTDKRTTLQLTPQMIHKDRTHILTYIYVNTLTCVITSLV